MTERLESLEVVEPALLVGLVVVVDLEDGLDFPFVFSLLRFSRAHLAVIACMRNWAEHSRHGTCFVTVAAS